MTSEKEEDFRVGGDWKKSKGYRDLGRSNETEDLSRHTFGP